MYGQLLGWGTIYFGGPTSSVLQEVNVRVWNNTQCAENYGRLNRKVTNSMLCAGERGRDACQVTHNFKDLIFFHKVAVQKKL